MPPTRLISAHISPVGKAPSWLTPKQEFESRGGGARASGTLRAVGVVDTQ